ncbi:MAG: hypothetical protein JXC36_08420 [Candidatus Atribacteria bacterium]|nr:hypothetical protein [Candidatus Atribacteria bacterium]
MDINKAIYQKARNLGLNACEISMHYYGWEKLGIQGIDRFQKRLLKSPDQDVFRDHWLEGTYASKFAKSCIPVTYEPCGDEGPDLLICFGIKKAFIEVKHLRSEYDSNASSKKMVSWAIWNKLQQLISNEVNILIIHSDRDEISKSAFYKGIYLCKGYIKGKSLINKWANLSLIIIYMPFFDSAHNDPFYWRFLRTSRCKVPRSMRKQLKDFFKKQILIEHQKADQLPIANTH